MDFKFKITDLLEIYLLKSKNPKNIFTNLTRKYKRKFN